MKFTYTYRSSDGQRHSDEMEGKSRDAVFAALRERGIKPIKVLPADNEMPVRPSRAVSYAIVSVLAAAVVVLGSALWWRHNRQNGNNAPYEVMTAQGPVSYTVAMPLPRQAIPGDRNRIVKARTAAFSLPAERFLARFAEPGRSSGLTPKEHDGLGETDFTAALREPIRIASTDFTEVIDLKRIVAGMKREMRTYIAGGGTVDGYLIELEKRQLLEISYRENAEKRLNEILASAIRDEETSGGKALPQEASHVKPAAPHPHTIESTPIQIDPMKAAYAYWLKANAQLQAMGIYPLALPDALRSYQMSLDIEE